MSNKMNLNQLWKNRKKPTISFEIFPARDEKAAKKLGKVLDALAGLSPDFVSVTFGAGGFTRDGSYDLAKKLKEEKGLQVLPYLAAYGLSPDDIAAVIDRYNTLGIEGLFCVRGDKPVDTENFQAHPDSFTHATDLLAFVNDRYNLFTGAAGYPEGHVEAKSKDQDLQYLKMKVQKGARFIIAQYVYDNRFFLDFVEKCRAMDIDVPILAGVMPIYSVKMMENLAALCGATITDQVKDGLAQLPQDDKKAVTDFGIQFAVNQCRHLIQKGVDGLHFYTMDKSKTIAEVLTQLRGEGVL